MNDAVIVAAPKQFALGDIKTALRCNNTPWFFDDSQASFFAVPAGKIIAKKGGFVVEHKPSGIAMIVIHRKGAKHIGEIVYNPNKKSYPKTIDRLEADSVSFSLHGNPRVGGGE